VEVPIDGLIHSVNCLRACVDICHEVAFNGTVSCSDEVAGIVHVVSHFIHGSRNTQATSTSATCVNLKHIFAGMLAASHSICRRNATVTFGEQRIQDGHLRRAFANA